MIKCVPVLSLSFILFFWLAVVTYLIKLRKSGTQQQGKMTYTVNVMSLEQLTCSQSNQWVCLQEGRDQVLGVNG